MQALLRMSQRAKRSSPDVGRRRSSMPIPPTIPSRRATPSRRHPAPPQAPFEGRRRTTHPSQMSPRWSGCTSTHAARSSLPAVKRQTSDFTRPAVNTCPSSPLLSNIGQQHTLRTGCRRPKMSVDVSLGPGRRAEPGRSGATSYDRARRGGAVALRTSRAVLAPIAGTSCDVLGRLGTSSPSTSWAASIGTVRTRGRGRRRRTPPRARCRRRPRGRSRRSPPPTSRRRIATR
jgi:hypothetical protein